VDASGYHLDLRGPKEIADQLHQYTSRLPRFLENGWVALNEVVPWLKANGKWDPSPDPEPPPYRPWRFFLPHGMAMINQRSLQFFHYPPIRLLETTRDYLDDPVPVRCEELQRASGVAKEDVLLYNCVVDAAPVAAEDDQGSKKAGDPKWGLIPIQYFHAYQREQVRLLLNTSPHHDAFTVPIVVYGAHPRDTFNELFGVNLSLKTPEQQVAIAEIIPGKKTPVICSNHPYVFYGKAQDFDHIGSGHFYSKENCTQATATMIQDLVVTRWQKVMSDDPTQDPVAAIKACNAYWADPARAAVICALVKHQGSLFYSNPITLAFTFNVSLEDAQAFCQANQNQPCACLQEDPT
jgi:hypothetical protein